MKKIVILGIMLFIFVGCNANRSESSTVEYSEKSNNNSQSESTSSLNSEFPKSSSSTTDTPLVEPLEDNPNNSEIKPSLSTAAYPIKLENKWDYQNGYPREYKYPSHILEIPPNPFHIPDQLNDNYTTSPWIITQGTLSDSTYLPETFIVAIYENGNSDYIQVSVEASYGVVYHKIPGLVSPYYIDCMVLYTFNNSDIQMSGGALIINNEEYQAKELTKYIIYSDDIITVYNAFALLSESSFEEKLEEFIKNPPADYIEGMTPGFAYNYDDIVKTKDYLVNIIPQMIHERK